MSIEVKIANREKKAKSVLDGAKNDLNELVNYYFNNYEELKDKYDKINLEWKKRVAAINSLQKVIKLLPNSFEVEVARIIKENPKFQTVTDLTKL